MIPLTIKRKKHGAETPPSALPREGIALSRAFFNLPNTYGDNTNNGGKPCQLTEMFLK